MMRKPIYLLAIALLVAACGSSSEGASGPTPTVAALVVEPSAAPTASAGPEIKTDFVATDPGTVELAAGRPQLVEFFAFW